MTWNFSTLSKRWVFGLGAVFLFVYCAWLLGPYLQSVFVRDASVTSWARASTAPISGKIVSEIPLANTVIGADGHLATIRNDRLFEETNQVTKAQNRVELARAQITEFRKLSEEIAELEAERNARKNQYAKIFRAELDSTLKSLERQLAVKVERIAMLERTAAKRSADSVHNNAARTTTHEARSLLAALKEQRASLEAKRDHARLRRSAADRGVFIEADGSDPAWAQPMDTSLKLQQFRTRQLLHQARLELAEAQASLETAKAALRGQSEAVISVPPGSVILSMEVPPGATVVAGDTIAKWVDCSALLVDVPVSDAELPLIRQKMKATVILEGESSARGATVLLARGSTATLDRHNLAALSKGRQAGVAQVILELDSAEMPGGDCPVGRAAYASFPEIGLIDVIRARLRL